MYDLTGTTGVLASVTGSADHVAPVKNLFLGTMHIWEAGEVFTGDQGEDKFIPKKGDMVIDHDTAVMKKVVSVNDATGLSTLASINTGNTYNSVQRTYGYSSPDTFRLYVNDQTLPNTAVVNKRLTVSGSQTGYAKVYRGANNADHGEVISVILNTDGSFKTNRIPLELVDDSLNTVKPAIWSAKSFKVNQDLQDGEVVTVVYFNDADHIVHKANLLVENTAFIGEAYGALKFVESIDLVSPFFKADDPTTLKKLINTPITDVNMRLVVNYSDGSRSQEYPLSSPEFELLGLEAAENMSVPATVQIIAKYNMAANEGAVNTFGDGNFMTRSYNLELTVT